MRQFAEEIAGKIKGYLPKEYQDMECGVEETRKNNGVYRTGISLRRPGERIGIVIYMEPYEEKYRQGKPLDEIVRDAAAEAKEAYDLGRTYPIDGLNDFEQIKDRLEPVLINARANRELLRDIPHERLEDLAVAFRTVRFTETGVMSMRVTDEHLEKWGIGKEELKRQAFANVQASGKYVLQELKDCLIELFGEGRSKSCGNSTQSFTRIKNSLLSLEGFTDGEGNVIDFIADEAVDVVETVVHAVMMDRLKVALSLLSDGEQALVKAIFFEELSEREVGLRLGITQSVVNKRKAKILAKLRTIIEN